MPAESIIHSIRVLRGQRVIIDSNLAAIHGVVTRTLNQAVKRNAERFPEDFRFLLTLQETKVLRSQTVILKGGSGSHVKYVPGTRSIGFVELEEKRQR